MALFEGVGRGRQRRHRRHAPAGRRTRRAAGGRGGPAWSRWRRATGLERLFAELGADVVPGGETLNPSTSELLAGIHGAEAEEVLVLPSSSNVIMAAERACELSEKPARVVPATSQQASLLALVELDPAAALDDERRAGRGGAGRRRHRRRRAGGPRRRPGTLQARRRGRLRRRRDRRLGRGRVDAAGDDRDSRRRASRDRHRHRRRRGADPARPGRRPRPRRGRAREARGGPAELVVAARGAVAVRGFAGVG